MFAATIALAKEAGLTAVAVGIETNRQLALARELDCTVGQGFLLHGPAAPRGGSSQGGCRGGNVRAMASPRATGRQRPPLSDGRLASARSARRPGPLRSWCRTGCASGWAPARRSPTCCRRSRSAGCSELRCVATSPATAAAASALGCRSKSWTRWASWTWRSTAPIRSIAAGGS